MKLYGWSNLLICLSNTPSQRHDINTLVRSGSPSWGGAPNGVDGCCEVETHELVLEGSHGGHCSGRDCSVARGWPGGLERA